MIFVSLLLSTIFWLIPISAHAEKSIYNLPHLSVLSNDEEFLLADEAFILNTSQENNQITFQFTIAPEYYLYRQQFRFEFSGLTLPNIDLPSGLTHEDEYFGVQQIYKGQFSFTANVEEVRESANITITYQGCAEKGLCYPPISKVIAVDEVTLSTGN